MKCQCKCEDGDRNDNTVREIKLIEKNRLLSQINRKNRLFRGSWELKKRWSQRKTIASPRYQMCTSSLVFVMRPYPWTGRGSPGCATS